MGKSRLIVILMLLFPIAVNSYSQNVEVEPSVVQDSNNVNIVGLVAVGAITPIALTGVYIYMNNAWWNGAKTDFHFDDGEDLKYARNLDKFGHYTSSCLVSNAFGDILRIINVPENWALWGGASLSIVNATVIEIKDGYAPWWGFSVYDEMANVLGAVYPVLQAKVPFFQNFNFKWSYDIDYSYETEYYKYKVAHGTKEAYSFIDDYDRQYFWLTVDWANLFCKNKPQYKFPYCIDFAIALSGENLKTMDATKDEHTEVYIGFDVNLTKFFKKKSVGHYIAKYVNFYHLPLPALQVAPKGKGYWIMY